jgi:hypothetical protein
MPKPAAPAPITPKFREDHPLFKAGDWKCSMCANINWERRDKCNVCGTPKPGAANEQRTGKGGGFNERQDTGDRRTRAADDAEEFDEFGRRKKKTAAQDDRSDRSDRDRDRRRSSSRYVARKCVAVDVDVGVDDCERRGKGCTDRMLLVCAVVLWTETAIAIDRVRVNAAIVTATTTAIAMTGATGVRVANGDNRPDSGADPTEPTDWLTACWLIDFMRWSLLLLLLLPAAERLRVRCDRNDLKRHDSERELLCFSVNVNETRNRRQSTKTIWRMENDLDEHTGRTATARAAKPPPRPGVRYATARERKADRPRTRARSLIRW